MVTKAELEAEVAELRRQLAEHAGAQKGAPTSNSGTDSGPKASAADGLLENLDSWSAQVEEVMTELEEFPHKKPILFALGIFTLGFILGRSR